VIVGLGDLIKFNEKDVGLLEQLDNGDLRFTEKNGAVVLISVYEHDLIRVRYWKAGAPDRTMRRTWTIADLDGERPLEGTNREKLDNFRKFTRPAYQLTQREGDVQIRIDPLVLEIIREPFGIHWSDGSPLAADNALLGYRTDPRTGAVAHTLNRTLDEHYYGFGEAAGPLDKHSRLIRMRNADAFGYDAETSNPLYKHVPFYITLRDRPDPRTNETVAFGLFYDTPYDCEFDLGAEIDNYYGEYRVFRAAGGDLDYYFLYGPTIEHVLETYTHLTGRIPLPPRWSLGYLASGMRYTDAPNAQEMLRQFIEMCHEHAIPCSAFHLSSGYSQAEDGKRYVFVWNRARVPEPLAMTQTFHDAGMHVAANIKPAMLTTHPRYTEAKTLFIRSGETDTPDLAPFWGGQGAHLDFTNPATQTWWKESVTRQLLEFGIDCTWNDNNEFNIHNDAARCDGFGEGFPIVAGKPIQTLLMIMASHQAQRDYAPEARPWLLTRAGMPGVQHYAATWTGDNFSSWKTLRYNTAMGLGMSLSGFANVGHDVGGFAGDPPAPELFVRWVQNGIFHPRFCIHSWRGDSGENAPWMHPDVLPLVRDAIKFRYSLIPYFYSLFWECNQTGHPVLRPTVYHFQNDAQCHQESFDFLVGSSVLVASVFEPGDQQRCVYLPRGTGWYDWHTGDYYAGGQTITLDAPLDRIPLLVREGGIIPTEQEGRRRVYVFPPRTEGENLFRLYEDDGLTTRYLNGDFRVIDLRMTADSESVRLESGVEVEWILPSGEQRQIHRE
jgi:alpha-glucosidase